MEAGRAIQATERNWQHPDLRSWLQRLVATDRLVVAREGVSLIDELAAVAKKLELENAVLFPRPGGHAIPVVANLFADRSWIADSLGIPTGELLSRFQHAVRHPLPWVEVTAAPVHEVIHREIDLLRQLPIPKHNEHDSGPYITAALLIARNPKTGIQNVSIHRCQISGPDRIGVLLLPRHTRHYFRMAEEAGEALEIALVIGVHPACILASQAIAALDDDEMEIAGALLGRPVGDVGAVAEQTAFAGLHEAGKDHQEGGLARTGGPKQRQELAPADIEGQIIQRTEGAEALADPDCLDLCGVAGLLHPALSLALVEIVGRAPAHRNRIVFAGSANLIHLWRREGTRCVARDFYLEETDWLKHGRAEPLWPARGYLPRGRIHRLAQ